MPMQNPTTIGRPALVKTGGKLPIGTIQYLTAAQAAADSSLVLADGRDWSINKYPGLKLPPSLVDAGIINGRYNGYTVPSASKKTVIWSDTMGDGYSANRLDVSTGVVSNVDFFNSNNPPGTFSYINDRYITGAYYSLDEGYNWNYFNGPESGYNTIGYAGGLWIAFSQSFVSGKYYTSPDFQNWTARTIAGFRSNEVVYPRTQSGNVQYIDSNLGNPLVTLDGINWSASTAWSSIQFANGKYYASNGGTLYVSSNGSSYTLMASPSVTNVSFIKFAVNRNAIWGFASGNGYYSVYRMDMTGQNPVQVLQLIPTNGNNVLRGNFLVAGDGSMLWDYWTSGGYNWIARIKFTIPKLPLGISDFDGAVVNPYIKVTA